MKARRESAWLAATEPQRDCAPGGAQDAEELHSAAKQLGADFIVIDDAEKAIAQMGDPGTGVITFAQVRSGAAPCAVRLARAAVCLARVSAARGSALPR